MSSHSCPLCGSSAIVFYFEDKKRSYLNCADCGLVFVPSQFHLNWQEQKQEYDLHENSVDDIGYRRFLERLADPVLAMLATKAAADYVGLDFGCGPAPLLAQIFEENGLRMQSYDPLYAPKSALLEKCYHFITISEVAEHFTEPLAEFERLWKMLRPGGLLAVMTKRVIDRERFAGWHYKNDPTHITFLADASVRWLAGYLGAELSLVGADVFLLHKQQL